MKTLKQDWLIYIVLLIPFVFIAIYWNDFPDTIPTHFDLEGKPNDWSSKATGLFLLSGINVFIYLVLVFAPKIDPSRAKFALFSEKYRIIRIVIHLFIVFVFFNATLPALGYEYNSAILVMYGLLVLFMLLGNYLGNVRHNYFIGVRTPWTLANEVVWTKTHRLTAKLWVLSSLVAMLVLPFITDRETLFLVYLIVVSVVPIVYSYVIFRKIKQQKQ